MKFTKRILEYYKLRTYFVVNFIARKVSIQLHFYTNLGVNQITAIRSTMAHGGQRALHQSTSPNAIHVSASSGANLVTEHPRIRGGDMFVVHCVAVLQRPTERRNLSRHGPSPGPLF
jgi:hypothetical protein